MKLYLLALAVVVAAVSADVSHLPPSYEYLPPAQVDSVSLQAPVNDYLPPLGQQVQPEELLQDIQYQAPADQPSSAGHVLADDGYHYKTNRRVVYRLRHRRDVSHLPQNKYLPPVAHPVGASVDVPTNQYLAPSPVAAPVLPIAAAPVAAPSAGPAGLGGAAAVPEVEHGIQHDSVSVVPEVYHQAAAVAEVAPVEAAEPAHSLAADGYHYKTNRRVVYRLRHRRDVSHLPHNQYLPPGHQGPPAVGALNNQYLAPAAPVSSPLVNQIPADHGIQHDVAEVYNPAPVAETPQVVAQGPLEAAAPAHSLAEDGYHYKTNRRVVYRLRQRRDVSHLAANEYLPPVQEHAAPNNEYLAPVAKAAPGHNPPLAPEVAQVISQASAEAEPAHTVSDDGYHYKTQRRVVYRRH